LLVLTRITILFLPIYSKLIIDELGQVQSNHSSIEAFAYTFLQPISWPWKLVSFVVLLRIMVGSGGFSGGFFDNLRQTIWVKIEQYTSLAISVNVFSHLHRFVILNIKDFFKYVFHSLAYH
jgi:hypothetical protein